MATPCLRLHLYFMMMRLSILPVERSLGFAFLGSFGFMNQGLGSMNVREKPQMHRWMSSFDDLLGDVEEILGGTNNETLSRQLHSTAYCDAWKKLDWEDVVCCETKPSPVEVRTILGRRVFVKRDNLLRLPGSRVSGNKARKMLALNTIEEFPACIVSYGGPQSNSMLALAAICNHRSLENESTPKPKFVYYTKKLPRFLRRQPSGNLFRALSLGMELRELSHREYKDLFGSDWGGNSDVPIGLTPPILGDSLWVPQGGACPMASIGVRVLAKEIIEFWAESGDGKPLSVCVPGGTCATAVLLHHQLRSLLTNKDDIEVVVIPCVGDAGYARRQMMSLSCQSGFAAEDVPSILLPAPDKITNSRISNVCSNYFNFAEPHKAILDTFAMLWNEYDLLVDLIYGAPSWTVLLRHWGLERSLDLDFDPNNPIAGREIMYVHSGGLEGVNSQLLRYQYEGLVKMDDIQLPGRNRQ